MYSGVDLELLWYSDKCMATVIYYAATLKVYLTSVQPER